MFPIIRDIHDLLPRIQHRKEIAVKQQPNGTTTVCYTIANSDTFADEYLRECRGITFGANGKIICRPLHKFFNVGEKEETQIHNIDWNETARVMDKRDGSMITPIVIDGRIACKTKKSFDTDQAIRANQYINQNSNYHQFVFYCESIGATPIFEWTSPQDRIVLKYNYDELTLLQIRDNITGEYYLNLSDRSDFFNISRVSEDKPFSFDHKGLIARTQKEENKEGYIVQFKNGDMVKLKTPWYINLHHSVTFTRERDIVEMVLDEKLDDFKSYLSQIGESHDKVLAIENKVLDSINDIRIEVETFVNKHHHLSRKEMAEVAGDHPYFGLIMQEYSNVEPRYRDFFKRNYLKDYSLETV